MVALGGAQHRTHGLVLLRPDHPRIRRRHLEGAGLTSEPEKTHNPRGSEPGDASLAREEAIKVSAKKAVETT
ncbi:hypothetical protein PSA5_03110, partial [Pseudomonas syringae pv. actinidiae]